MTSPASWPDCTINRTLPAPSNNETRHSIQADPALARALKLNQSQIEQLLSARKASDGYLWHHHQT
ncbi:MAG: HNH endonuclease [Myxococcaceae bacterium]|nr:HNH endonuclease [Myxococcaceae bacterium]